jgi:hypothetical protein
MASNITKSETQLEMDLKKKLHNDIFEFVVCQICLEVPKYGAIYTCDSGDHATCNDCWNRFTAKRVCKCKAVINCRNKGLEKVRTTLPLSCKFRKNGCSAVLTLESLLYHEVECQFRAIFCPVRECQKEVPRIVFKNLEDHLTEYHKDYRSENTSYIESYYKYFSSWFTPSPTKLALNNAQFFLLMAMDEGPKDLVYIWVYYYGSPEEAKNYHCSIKLFGDGEEYIYNGPPRSLDESHDQIIREDHALSLGCLRVLDESIKYSVKISCPKDEVKDEDVESGISDNENTTSNSST